MIDTIYKHPYCICHLAVYKEKCVWKKKMASTSGEWSIIEKIERTYAAKISKKKKPMFNVLWKYSVEIKLHNLTVSHPMCRLIKS